MTGITLSCYTRCLTLLVLFCALGGCQKKASEEIEFGAVNDSVYTNKFFGMTLPLPKEWSVQDEQARKNIADKGLQIAAGDDKGANALMKIAEQRTVNLIAIYKHPMGAPVPFNPSFIGIAEQVNDLPGVKRGKDYLYHVRKALESSQLKVEFTPAEYSETLSGVEFDVMPATIFVSPSVGVHQKQFATIMKGYALFFVISFSTDEEEAELMNVIQQLKFKPA